MIFARSLSALRRPLLYLGIFLLVLTALLATGGRWLMANLSPQQARVEQVLSGAIGHPVTLASLDGAWTGLRPRLQARGVRVETRAGEPLLRLRELTLELDLLASLLHLRPVLHYLLLDAPELDVYQQAGGGWQLASTWRRTEEPDRALDWEALLETLWLQEHIQVRDARLTPVAESGRLAPWAVTLGLEKGLLEHRIVARLAQAEGPALEFKAHTRGTPLEPRFAGDFYLRLDALQQAALNPLLPRAWPRTQRLSGGAELWGRWQAGALRRVQGQLRLDELDWPEHLGEAPLQALQADVFLEAEAADHWRLQLHGIEGALGGQALPLAALRLARAEQQLTVSAPRLELAAAAKLAGTVPAVPARVKAALAELSPAGALHRPWLRLPLERGQLPEGIRMRADLEQVAVGAWKGAPAVAGVNGLLRLEGRGGSVDLDTAALSLGFPGLFADTWQFDKARGRVSWHVSREQARVESELLQVVGQGLKGYGRFALQAPFSREAAGGLTLMIGVEGGRAEQVSQFVPVKGVPESLRRWLGSAITQGRVEGGGFLFHGPLRSGHGERTVQMFFDVDGVDLAYQPRWPALTEASGRVMVKDRGVEAVVERGRVFEETLVTGARVRLQPGSTVLGVSAGFQGPAADGRRVLLESPLQTLLGDALEPWQWQGRAETALSLAVDLKGEAQPVVDVSTALAEGRLWSPSLALEFSQLKGSLGYSTRGGFRAENLDGLFFERPVQARIETRPEGQGQKTQVQLAGTLPVEGFNDHWLRQPILSHFEGETPYRASLDICTGGASCLLLTAVSNLEGVSANLPAPYAKPPSAAEPLEVRLGLGRSPLSLEVDYGQALRARLELENGSLKGGEVVLGVGQAPPAAGVDGLWIRGALPQAALMPWQAFVRSLLVEAPGSDSEPGAPAEPLLRGGRLKVDEFTVGERNFGALEADMAPLADGWELRLDGAAAKGVARLPRGDSPYSVRFDYLHVPAVPAPDESETASLPAAGLDETDPLAEADPSSLPLLYLDIGELTYDGAPFGRWRLQVEPQDNGARVAVKEGRIRHADVGGELWWTWDEGGHYSRALLDVRAKDIGRVMTAWGSASPLMESETAKISGELMWRGSPANFNLPSLSGELALDVRDGRILKAGRGSGLLRLFGILNLETISRRLRLDFSDLYQRGLAFDRIRGAYLLNLGTAVTERPLRIEGPSVEMSLEGAVNLVEETLNQQVRVTLPLSENLPLAAALLVSPQVAGAVFLIEKVIGEQLGKFTTVRYLVYGSWEDPVVEPIRSQADGVGVQPR
ncbi:YhdP family protein [Motiliproteus sp. SC1-56]|uniref:YhdP family protein n=1 Tax=Motiliproteus sp. SC1-56 TaxID=2799565 RepID=UPI001A909BDE|nr:YhdP family protein [Motiliproteus sp. SC1-56]